MRNVAVIALFLGVVAVCAAQVDKYTTRYDGIDIDQILKSDRLFNNYYNCLMEKGKCTPDGRELKRKYTAFGGQHLDYLSVPVKIC